jgi:chorismate mutase
MLISELTFPHLAEARDAQLVQQLERRRVVAERLAEASADAPAPARRRRERMPRARVATNGPCPA